MGMWNYDKGDHLSSGKSGESSGLGINDEDCITTEAIDLHPPVIRRCTRWWRRLSGSEQGRGGEEHSSMWSFFPWMVCTICHSHCESDNEQTFRIVIRDDYEALANIPCTERNMFNQMSGLNYKADDRRYVFDVYRGHEATLIGGDDWTKFKRDFDVGQGNVVVFDMTGEQQREINEEHISLVCVVNALRPAEA
uniref:TF-B3 domain-containing protein n=1 Tax=Aegilops tauschii TaxID=37682 RepID=M8AVV3_AEGTA